MTEISYLQEMAEICEEKAQIYARCEDCTLAQFYFNASLGFKKKLSRASIPTKRK